MSRPVAKLLAGGCIGHAARRIMFVSAMNPLRGPTASRMLLPFVQPSYHEPHPRPGPLRRSIPGELNPSPLLQYRQLSSPSLLTNLSIQYTRPHRTHLQGSTPLPLFLTSHVAFNTLDVMRANSAHLIRAHTYIHTPFTSHLPLHCDHQPPHSPFPAPPSDSRGPSQLSVFPVTGILLGKSMWEYQ